MECVSWTRICETIQNPFLKQAVMLPWMEPSRGTCGTSCGEPGLHGGERRATARCSSRRRILATIGILGAVLGLIQVMQHLDNIQEVGRGIAVAFVATIYGVGIANLFFLPFAGKMRIRMHDEHQRREMMLEGVISILEGINPRMLEVKLSGFLDEAPSDRKGRAA